MISGKYVSRFAVLTAALAGSALALVLTLACGSVSSPPTAVGFSAGGPCPPGGPCGSGGSGFGGPRPAFGPPTTASQPPPPISGGTLLVTSDGNTAIASDPDRDAVHVVDVAAQSVTFTIALQPGDEPGRLAEDGAGRVHVALRGGGALVTIDPKTGTVLGRRGVCPAPRGVAWDAPNDFVWVACATGELVAFPSAGGPAARLFVVERDLRDVIVQPDGSLAVSKFRSAEVLRVSGDGAILRRDSLFAAGNRSTAAPAPHVAWRTVAGPSLQTTIAVHQLESTQPISTSSPGGYSGGSGPIEVSSPLGVDGGGPGPTPVVLGGSIVESAMTILASDGTPESTRTIPEVVLPVDVAVSSDGSRIAIAAAGAGFTPLPSVWLFVNGGFRPAEISNVQVVAVAFDQRGDLLAQRREPSALLVLPAGGGPAAPIALSDATRADTGHDIFHTQAGGLVACASCHPEGGDDGHLWLLEGLPRRTPSLRGTIAGTAPYHWPGDEKTMQMLVTDVYTGRMGGAPLDPLQEGALAQWVQSIPAPAPPSWIDSVAALRGKALFAGAGACSTCHAGPKFTNNMTVDVGTGKDTRLEFDGGSPPTAFQVPPLVGVGWRTPLLHDGCAVTIADRFGKCATPAHGATSKLSSQDVSDLTAYLESL
jgi:DNA-binding beta-propeller fold protein YncE/cytochrome c553